MLEGQDELVQEPEDETQGFTDIGDMWDAKVKEIAGQENIEMVDAFVSFAKSQLPTPPTLEDFGKIGETLISSYKKAIKGYNKTGVIDEKLVTETLKEFEGQPLLRDAVGKSVTFLKKVNTINFPHFNTLHKGGYVIEGVESALQQVNQGKQK